MYPQKSPAIRVSPRKILLPASQVCTGDLYYVNTLISCRKHEGRPNWKWTREDGIPLILLLFEETVIFIPSR
jgi:hypothetical protein